MVAAADMRAKITNAAAALKAKNAAAVKAFEGALSVPSSPTLNVLVNGVPTSELIKAITSYKDPNIYNINVMLEHLMEHMKHASKITPAEAKGLLGNHYVMDLIQKHSAHVVPLKGIIEKAAQGQA